MHEIINIITPSELGSRLRLVRTVALNYTQVQISNELNIPPIIISKIERGENVVSTQLIKLLAYYSQFVSIDILFSKKISIENLPSLISKNVAVESIAKEKVKELAIETTNKINLLQKEVSTTLQDVLKLL